MKVAFLLYEDEARWDALSPSDQEALIGRHMAYVEALEKAGVMRGGAPLAPSSTAQRLKAGTVQDGPYADTKEQLGGFYTIEVETAEQAEHWARECPLMEGSVLEIRPIPDYGGGA